MMRAFHIASAFGLVLGVLNAGVHFATAASCADRVSTGDQSVGISAVKDASCASGGLGCFPGGVECRLCKVTSTVDSDHLTSCSEIPVTVTTASDSTTDDGLESTIDCAAFVSVGDQGVGISAIAASNPSCTANGVGCFNNGQCRFCQTRATSQSAAFLKCTSSTGSTPTPAVTAASTSTTCSNVVSRSGLEGISYITDSRCNVASPTLLGCSARTSCRLCRNFKNEANQYLVSCQVLNALRTESADAGSASSSSGNKGKTESVATGSSASGSHVKSTPVKNFAVTTENSSSVPGPKKSAGTPLAVPVAAAVVAVVMVMMMSVIYGKYRRDKYDNDIMTPDDCPMDDLVTPNSGPRHGSLVMVVSESSIATL